MVDWDAILIAWLHDPPDKALDIPGHVERARRYLEVALGRSVTQEELRGHYADQVGSATERLPMPRWDADPRARVMGQPIVVRHPLTAEERPLAVLQANQPGVLDPIIGQLVQGLSTPRDRFLKLWRFLPDELTKVHVDWLWMPADTRLPDHSIWQHLDTTAGLCAALSDGMGGAFLAWSIGPVQRFIAAARTLRDLWTGSMLLSWLTFRAMLPIIEKLGPTALVFPTLRGMPLMDLWLRKQLGDNHVELPSVSARISPCLPNRFLAMIPWGTDGQTAQHFARQTRTEAQEAWRQLAESVHRSLAPDFNHLMQQCGCTDHHWDRWWQWQIDDFFDIRVAVLPWRDTSDDVLARWLSRAADFPTAFSDLQSIRDLQGRIPAAHRVPGAIAQNAVGQWQLRVKLTMLSLGAQKHIRYYPKGAPPDAKEMVPAKCTLLGSLEQMGPAELNVSAAFWRSVSQRQFLGGIRVRKRERLSAVALVRRFAPACRLGEELEITVPNDLRFFDTATVAAHCWLERARQRRYQQLEPSHWLQSDPPWSGQWLYWTRQEQEEEDTCPDDLWQEIQSARKDKALGWPPAYYGVLAMDGDSMGKWLAGQLSPRLEQLIHPTLVDYFRSLPDTAEALHQRRPVTPALHAAISGALAQFSLKEVPRIVKEHGGMLVYAGGDDLLALLPVETALRCAWQLQEAFRQSWYSSGHIGMGERATMSAGLAVVHYKEDLQFALETARQAERIAKNQGRNRLVVTICRRSGEHGSVVCPWPLVADVEKLVTAFRQGASDRWTHRLSHFFQQIYGSSTSGPPLPDGALSNLVRQQLGRAESVTQQLLARHLDGGQDCAQAVITFGKKYLSHQAGSTWIDVIRLAQAASFFARGNER